MFTQPASSSSILAIATTVHLSLAALRNNRRLTSSPFSVLAAISLACAALPWIFPSPIGLGAGLIVHLAWFGVCEWLTPKRPAADPAPRAVAPQARAPKKTGFEQVTVLATFDETPTIKTIRLARPDGFDFEAGQFITVKVQADGRDYARCYSISSAPDTRAYLEISVRRQGVVSNALHTAIQPGASLAIRKPAGAFKYPSGDLRPIVLLAGGIGVTPLMSIVRHAVAVEPTRPVTLVYSAHNESDFAFRDELGSLARRHPQLRVLFTSSVAGSDPEVRHGRIDERLLRASIPELAHSIAYVCGPGPMIDAMKALLAAVGIPADRIRHEVFAAAVAASSGLASADASAKPAAGNPSTARALHHRMRCSQSRTEIAIQDGQTLLDAAEAQGVPIDSLCRSGVCGTCRLQVTDGDVACQSSTLDEDDVRRGFVLACVTTTRSDCTVRL